MVITPSTRLFAAGQGISPYLADWHRIFARLDPARTEPLELYFDRGRLSPVREAVRLPQPLSPDDRHIAELYLAVLVNNVLCTRGARRVSILAGSTTTAREMTHALTRLLLLRPDDFSNMSLQFLYALAAQAFDTPFIIDADREHALSLRERLDRQEDAAREPGNIPKIRPGTVLAINIGQRLTSQALVTIDASGRFTLERLSRRDTWMADSRQCLTAALDALTAGARDCLGPVDRTVDAVGISIAATVLAGTLQPVAQFGLYADCSAEEYRDADAALRRAAAAVLPGRPVNVINDGEGQALFAFHYSPKTSPPQPDPPSGKTRSQGGMLSIRLGACPAVHMLDGSGRAAPGFHEYGWLVTRYTPARATAGFFSTIRLYLSHYGVAVAAHELGLLEKYRLPFEAAIPFFHEALLQDAPSRNDALRVYGVLGAHLAMLAEEVNRFCPLGVLRLLGSQANRIDAPAFAAMTEGFAAFCAGHDASVAGLRLELLEDTSAVAGLVGAAHAALRRS